MEILLIAPIIILLLTLLVPAFASQGPDDPEAEAQKRERISRKSSQIQLEAARELVKVLREQGKIVEAQRATDDLDLRVAQERAELARDELRNVRLTLAEKVKFTEKEKETLKNAARKLALAQQQTKELKKQIALEDKAADNIVGALEGMTGISDKWQDSIVGSFVGATTSAEGYDNTMKKVGAGMEKSFTGANILGSTLTKVAEATLAVAEAQDQAISSFVKTTGANEGYTQTIETTFLENRHLGVSFAEAGAAMESLYTNMADFTNLSGTTQARLAENVALMNEFGISTDVSAQALDVMTKVMGMSALQAANLSEELVNTAERIGVPPARLLQELAATAPALAKYGDQQIDVFKSLAAAAKATGIEIGSLIGIASQYDTFEGAAEAAGRLNAVLGGPYLNSIELLNANEEERIRMLIQTISLTGRSWNELGRFEKQAVASAAGISDMSEASRIFGQSLSEYDRATSAAEGLAAAQQELDERAIEAQTVFDMMTSAFNSFAIAIRPIVIVLKVALEQVAKFVGMLTGTPIASIITGIALAIMTVRWAMVALATPPSPVFVFVAITTAVIALISALNELGCWLWGCSPDGLIPGFALAAENMKEFTASAKAAKPALRDLSISTGNLTAVKPALRDLSMPTGNLTTSVSSLVTTKSNNADMKHMFDKLIKSNEATAKRLEQVSKQETVLKLNDREFGRATKNVINKGMRLQKAAM